jgi:hypothetical protein
MTSAMAAAMMKFEAFRGTATAFRAIYLLIPTCRPARIIGIALGSSAPWIIAQITAKKTFLFKQLRS